MKIYDFILSFCILLSISCTSDNNIDDDSLRIVESNLVFNSNGGTGSITIESTSPFNIKSSESWCTVDGTKNATVSVEPNHNIEGRSAVLTITTDRGAVSYVPVVQAGHILMVYGDSIIGVDNNAHYREIDISSSDGVSVICDQEWLTGSINGTKLILQTEKNKTGGIRSTTVVLRGMNNSVNIKVIQGDISEILGEYELSGSSITTVNARGNGYLHPATIKAVLQNDDLGIGYELSLPEYDYVIPLRNNDKNSFLLILNGGKHVGTVKVRNTEYALFTAFSDKSGSSVTFSMETAMDILFDNVNNTVVGSFMDIGSWRGNKADALCLYAALPSSITSILDATSYNGWWLRVESPFLKKKE